MKLRILSRTGLRIEGKGYFNFGDEVEIPDEEAVVLLEDYPHTYEKVVEAPAPRPAFPLTSIKRDED